MSCFKLRRKKSILKSVHLNTPDPNLPIAKPLSVADSNKTFHHETTLDRTLPLKQDQLVLLAAKEEYQLFQNVTIPSPINDSEAVVRIETLGLNPIDWKGPKYNFGLPSFPCVLGREYVGIVIQVPKKASKVQVGDVVLAISTDYRDYRKAAFQQFAIAPEANLCRLPVSVSRDKVASIGVAFVTATLLLGVCLGLRFPGGPDMLKEVRAEPIERLPEDIRKECHGSLEDNEHLRTGDWLAVWGAGSAVGFLTIQLAKLAGVRTIAIADAVKRGGLLVASGTDALVHRQDTAEAQAIVRSVTQGRLLFGVDTVGKESAKLLQEVLTPQDTRRAHIVGLTGLPKDSPAGIVQHKVPIKLFHEHARLGEKVMTWMEDLLRDGKLILPEVEIYADRGLGAVNGALNKLSSGKMQSQRIVVNL